MSRTRSHPPAGRRVRKNARRHGLALVVAVAALGPLPGMGGVAAQRLEPPPWTVCQYADHPAAADLVPVLPANVVPSDDVRAVLLGEVSVGTDCSIYELPV